jgi:hypothetical protein
MIDILYNGEVFRAQFKNVDKVFKIFSIVDWLTETFPGTMIQFQFGTVVISFIKNDVIGDLRRYQAQQNCIVLISLTFYPSH